MNEHMTSEEKKNEQLKTYNDLVIADYKRLEDFVRDIQQIEADRRFVGNWESNRKLQSLSYKQIRVLHDLNSHRQQIEFIEEGLRTFDLFSGI